MKNYNQKHTNLSKQELREYFDKNTPRERLQTLKHKVQNDLFLKEAMEGYEAFPGEVEKLDKLKKRISKKLFKTSFHYAYLLTVPVAAIIVILFLSNPTVEKAGKFELPLKEQNEITTLPDVEASENAENTTVEETNVAVGENVGDTEIKIQLAEKETLEKERLYIKAIDKIIPAQVLKIEHNGHHKPTKKKKNNFAVLYILDLKVADYRQRTPGNKYQPTNLEARYEFGGEISTDRNTTMVGYVTFLEETLEKFIAGDYKKALVNFKIIQKHYPNDVNALFYGGLCQYKLGNFLEAIASFEKAENYFINVFDEEAEWYRALSLEELNRKDELMPLLEKIISQEGFYAAKAKKILERN